MKVDARQRVRADRGGWEGKGCVPRREADTQRVEHSNQTGKGGRAGVSKHPWCVFGGGVMVDA